jgi:hypothetical protein
MGPLTESLKDDGCFFSAAEDSTTEPFYVKGRSYSLRTLMTGYLLQPTSLTGSNSLIFTAGLTTELQWGEGGVRYFEKAIPLADLLLHSCVKLYVLIVELFTCIE